MYLRGRRGDRHVTRGYRDVHTLVQPGVEVLRLLPLVTRFLSGTPVGVQKVIILKDNFKLAFPEKFSSCNIIKELNVLFQENLMINLLLDVNKDCEESKVQSLISI